MKIIVLATLLLMSGSTLLRAAQSEEQGTYTLTTYYPSPSGAYDTLSSSTLTVSDQLTVTNNATLTNVTINDLIVNGNFQSNSGMRRLLISPNEAWSNQGSAPLFITQNGVRDAGMVMKSGATAFAIGTDASDAAKFKINRGETPGANRDLVLDADGEVGIGNANPQYPLSVRSPNERGIELINEQDNKSWRLKPSGNDLHIAETGATTPLAFQAGGNVGIGTTTPKTRLEVNGSLMMVPNTGWAHAAVTSAPVAIISKSLEYDPGILIGMDDSLPLGPTDGTTPITRGVFQRFFSVGVDAGDRFQFKINRSRELGGAGINDFVIEQGGKVGIGTSNPSSRLDINGDIKVGYTDDCTASRAGAIRYNETSDRIEYCKKTGSWSGMGGFNEFVYAYLNDNPRTLYPLNGSPIGAFSVVSNVQQPAINTGPVQSAEGSGTWDGVACNVSQGWRLVACFESVTGNDTDLQYYNFGQKEGCVTNDYDDFAQVRVTIVCAR